MAFNYREAFELNDGVTVADWSTGTPCTVWRDGVKIAEVPGAGAPCWFADYNAFLA